jgi:hypothetical protein
VFEANSGQKRTSLKKYLNFLGCTNRTFLTQSSELPTNNDKCALSHARIFHFMHFRNITPKKTQSVKEELLQNPIVNFHRKENYLSEMLLRVLLVIELDDPSASVQRDVLSKFRPDINEVHMISSLLDVVPLESLKHSLQG